MGSEMCIRDRHYRANTPLMLAAGPKVGFSHADAFARPCPQRSCSLPFESGHQKEAAGQPFEALDHIPSYNARFVAMTNDVRFLEPCR